MMSCLPFLNGGGAVHDPSDESITNLVSLVTEAKEMYLYCPEKLLRREPLLSLLDLAEGECQSPEAVPLPLVSPFSLL